MRYFFSSLLAIACCCGIALGQQPNNAQPNNALPRPQPGQQLQPGQQQPSQQQPGQQQPGQPNQLQPRQQNQLQPGQQGQQRGQFAGQQGQHGMADQQIAAVVSGCAENEIEISKMAQSKAQSQEVKQFAEQMVRDHSPGYQEMKQLAGPLAGGQAHNANAAGGAAGHAGGLDWVQIHHQVGQQSLASIKEELNSKQGKEFDHCYMGQQIGAHMKAMDELKVLRNHASPELRPKLDKELETATAHYKKAKQIEEGLEGGSQDRSPDRTSRKGQ